MKRSIKKGNIDDFRDDNESCNGDQFKIIQREAGLNVVKEMKSK